MSKKVPQLTFGELYEICRDLHKNRGLTVSFTSGYAGWDYWEGDTELDLLLTKINEKLSERYGGTHGEV